VTCVLVDRPAPGDTATRSKMEKQQA
jgi:hypothetical protein